MRAKTRTLAYAATIIMHFASPFLEPRIDLKAIRLGRHGCCSVVKYLTLSTLRRCKSVVCVGLFARFFIMR